MRSAGCWEDEACVEPGRELVDRLECAACERHAPAGAFGLRVRLHTVTPESALDDDDASGSLYVAALEREPFGRPESCLGREDHERPIQRPELGCDAVNLRERERHDLGAG